VWDGKVPTHVRVIEVSEPGQLLLGDTIITTPASPLYPPDILVGTLQEYGKDEGSNFYTLDVKLSTNFGNLRYVYVVNNILKAERDSLEIQTIDAGN
jgi:rod shape-determining protein MreC